MVLVSDSADLLTSLLREESVEATLETFLPGSSRDPQNPSLIEHLSVQWEKSGLTSLNDQSKTPVSLTCCEGSEC